MASRRSTSARDNLVQREQRSSDSSSWYDHITIDNDDANMRCGSHEFSDHSNGSGEYEELPYGSSDAPFSADALIAHRQVLEMAATIETLTRDFERQQQELLHAYQQLNEYTNAHRKSDTEHDATPFHHDRSRSSNRDDYDDTARSDCCSHLDDLNALRKLVSVKDAALTEALQQRSEYHVALERAEMVIRDLRTALTDGSRTAAWKVHPTASNMGGYYATGAAMPCTQAALAPSFVPASASSDVVPRHERFDHASAYTRGETDALYWRKQYKDAVRMRKKPSAMATSSHGLSHPAHYGLRSSSTGGSDTAPRPSLKIFSFPDNRRRQRGITDETVPFARYIGISARQHEIIKEQHRMLA